ncbi:hypothetical protein B0O99DRAFT_203199 [Bisporella sp. PMI_857]|nr:hypothetical protein B0O99DRAFT_203199 [Bisporella sp. PMI_857]
MLCSIGLTNAVESRIPPPEVCVVPYNARVDQSWTCSHFIPKLSSDTIESATQVRTSSQVPPLTRTSVVAATETINISRPTSGASRIKPYSPFTFLGQILAYLRIAVASQSLSSTAASPLPSISSTTTDRNDQISNYESARTHKRQESVSLVEFGFPLELPATRGINGANNSK